jgi:predicted deacylase
MFFMSKISIGNIEVKPGTKVTGFLPTIGLQMPDGTGNFWNLPVIIVNGVQKGPVFEVDGCIHGEEQEGAYTVLELARRIYPEKLKGTFIGVPVLNVPAFLTLGGIRGSVTDKMYIDMNRQFPGDSDSMSHTRRAIHTFWNEIIKKCDYTVNLHGCLKAQIPRVVYNEEMPETLEMAKAIAFSPDWIIASRSEHTRLKEDTINRACTETGIPNVFIESGSSNRDFNSLKNDSDTVVNGIMNCMRRYGMIEGERLVPKYWRKTDYYTHVRGKASGIVYPEQCLKLNSQVMKGDLLCRIVDFLGNEIDRVHAPHDGIIIMESNEVSVGPDSGICILANTPIKIESQ